MNKATFWFLSLLCLIGSCEKKQDILEGLQFQEPFPENGAGDIRFDLPQRILFKDINDAPVRRILLDTVNPPLNQIDLKRPYVENLIPNTTYYWAYELESISGSLLSDIQAFTTISLDGNWELFAIGKNNVYLTLDNPDVEKYLTEDYDIIEIKINGKEAQIKPFTRENTQDVNVRFNYEADSHIFHFIDSKNDKDYQFRLITISCDEIEHKYTLTMKNESGDTFNYKMKK